MGGMTLGLRPLCKPVGFCDNNPGAKALIERRMRDHSFPKVPLFGDIRDITLNSVKDVDLLTAGFPCQDLSAFGHKLGLFGGQRSILVKEVFRLVQEMQPAFVFLENVPRIVRDEGYSRLLAALVKEGYEVAHLLHDAASLGGWHRRQRWFLLAHHPQRAAKLRKLESSWMRSLSRHLKTLQSYFLQAQKPTCDGERGHCRPQPGELHLLGNSVVPAVVCASFAELLRRVWATSFDPDETSLETTRSLKALDFQSLKHQGILLRKQEQPKQYELRIFKSDPRLFNDRKCSLAGRMWKVSPKFLIPHPARESKRYLPEPEDAHDWRASPLKAGSHANLPPALVITAGFDPLRDEGVLIVGSGFMTHGLPYIRDWSFDAKAPG
ncbi:hypothetical protein EBZ37_14180, partial [bacterium]|nr:hypothetical protein [bacterium]